MGAQKEDDFTVRTQEEIAKVATARTDVMTALLGAIASVFLLVGGIGIILGVAASKTVSGITGWPSLISVSSIAVSFLASSAVGIFFGFYPSRKAARLDPIEALRFE